jgi:hypothetical protein
VGNHIRGYIINRSVQIFAKIAIVFGLTISALMADAIVGTGRADSPPPQNIVPVDTNAYGNSYGEWGAQWWQWAYSIPAATNPILDTTGQSCGLKQSGPIFFLAGTPGSGPVTRNCAVPKGKALFFPIANALFGAAVKDCAPTNPKVVCNLADLRVAAAAAIDPVTLVATIDGQPVKNLTAYRVRSPELTITFPDGNIAGPSVRPDSYAPNVSDGYWLLVSPLSPGQHVIYFKAQITGGPFSGATIEATYNLTIA